MSFTRDSSLVDRVLPSPTGEWYSRAGYPIFGIMVHMAEGGGTDTHLSRLDGNSSHYVVKYDGDLVQMVPESYAAGSVNPRLIRSTNDGAFVFQGETIRYGITTLKAVLSPYSPTFVNRLIIAIEVEGFAASGPNPAQVATLKALVADIRRRRRTVKGTLGHRDAQSYKPCPGKKIPWDVLGGHGLFKLPPDTSTEDDVNRISFKIENWTLDGRRRITTVGAPVRNDGTIDHGYRLAALADVNGPYLALVDRDRLTEGRSDLDVPIRDVVTDYQVPTTDCSAPAAAARAEGETAGYAAAKDAAAKAVSAI